MEESAKVGAVDSVPNVIEFCGFLRREAPGLIYVLYGSRWLPEETVGARKGWTGLSSVGNQELIVTEVRPTLPKD